MSVDKLQEKIRKLKNPSVVSLNVTQDQLPPHLLEEEGSVEQAFSRFYWEILSKLRGVVPAVRVSYAHFAMLEKLPLLHELLGLASEFGYYTIVDAPDALSVDAARITAEKMLSLPCDGILFSSYIGSDGVKPYVKQLKESKKALFVVIRTANKSAVELQDLMTGTRLAHMAVADMVNRFGETMQGKSGYHQVAGLAGASSVSSIRTLRSKYPNMFLLLDGYDYPNANAKNCSAAFDKLGHGAAACTGSSIVAAWQEDGSDGRNFAELALQAAERMQKNLTRYITIL